jgi:hypothetical protein
VFGGLFFDRLRHGVFCMPTRKLFQHCGLVVCKLSEDEGIKATHKLLLQCRDEMAAQR